MNKEMAEHIEPSPGETEPTSSGQGRREFLKKAAAFGAGVAVGALGDRQMGEKGISKEAQAEHERAIGAAGYAEAGQFELAKGIRDLADEIEKLERHIDEQEKVGWSGSSFVTMIEKFAVISSETYRLGVKIAVTGDLKQVDKVMLDEHQSVLELKGKLEDKVEKIKGKYQIKLERR